MKLEENSYRWAIKHLYRESDTDLFPRPIELDILHTLESDLITELSTIDLGNYEWHSARRFLIPKDDLAYRNSTQLHLIDSIVLSGIIYQFGHLIERKLKPSPF